MYFDSTGGATALLSNNATAVSDRMYRSLKLAEFESSEHILLKLIYYLVTYSKVSCSSQVLGE